jgi:hypothetical protein
VRRASQRKEAVVTAWEQERRLALEAKPARRSARSSP